MRRREGIGESARSWLRVARGGPYRVQALLRRHGVNIERTHPNVSPHFYLTLLFRHYGIDCVLDVGASQGWYGRDLRRNGYRGQIVSFEPNSEEFERLTAEARGDARWSSHRLALGRRTGTLPLNVTHGPGFASFLPPSDYGTRQFTRGLSVVRQELVPIERLDAALPRLVPDFRSRRIALKIDTQGYDMEVLAGAAGILEHVMVLQTELAVRPLYEGVTPYLEALRQLHGMGFDLAAFFPGPTDPNDLVRLIELDCVMVRAPAGGPEPETTAARR